MATANDGLVISVDPQMFDQLLYNLIYNASAHNPAGTEIEIGASIKDEQVKIWVTDDGLGIPNADQDRIFERFVRLDAARGRKQGGSGMGLSIVKTIVEAHDGSIEVLSPVANGRGTSFRVRFVGMGSSGK
ncbi:MAG: sensor histidine kinase [Chloroflexota bacterium]